MSSRESPIFKVAPDFLMARWGDHAHVTIPLEGEVCSLDFLKGALAEAVKNASGVLPTAIHFFNRHEMLPVFMGPNVARIFE